MVEIDRLCASSGCENAGKHLCSGCGEEIYCSKECQKAHWPSHKLACKTATKPEAAAFLKSFDSLSAKQLKNIMKAKAATMEGKKKGIILNRLEGIVEKPALVKFVQEYVTPSEVEGLLTSSPRSSSSSSSTSSSSSSGPSSSSSSGSRGKGKGANGSRAGVAAAGYAPTPSPEQLKQQAIMMRRNPAMVRRAQPAFANLSDEQIRQYADQLEKAASDPAMMREVERMSQLSTDERTDLQNIQEGLAGVRPIDSAWIDSTIAALKTKTGMFKSMMKGKGAMMGGVSDEQIESFIDVVSKMDASTLRMICHGIKFLGSLYAPALSLYKTMDGYTFGGAKYIVTALGAFIAYYSAVFSWRVGRFIFLQLYALALFLYAALQGQTAASAPAAASAGVGAGISGGVADLASVAASGRMQKVAESGVGSAAAGALAASSVAAVVDALGNMQQADPSAKVGAGAGAAGGATAKPESADDEFNF